MSERKRITLNLASETFQQLDELCEALHVSRTTAATIAIARYYDDEPIVKRRRRRRRDKRAEQ